MVIELRPLLLFALYESALFIVAGRLVLLAWPSGNPARASSLALWVVATKLYLGALVAVLILMFVPDRLEGFRVASGMLAIAAAGALLAGSPRLPIASSPWRPGDWTLLGAIAIGAGLSIAGSAQPVREFDSLHNFNWLIRWLVEGRSPYAFAFDYVSFWESGYVPGLLLGESRYLHVWLSAQSLLLYLLALHVLAARVNLPRSICLSIVAAAAFLPWHWGWASGVPTLKNDTLASAGFLMAIGVLVGQLKGEPAGRRAGLALGLALTFMTVKYGGPVLAIPMLAFAVAVSLLRRRAESRATLSMLLVAVAVAAIGTGHFFIKNLVLHGNPLYPFALALGPLALPGTLDVAGTSILAHGADIRTWKLLFGLDPAGQPHMLLLRAAMIAPLLMLLVALVRRPRGASDIVLVAVFALAGWLAWLGSLWSAGTAPGSLHYLEELRSVRYATGAAGAGLVVLAVLLTRTMSLPTIVVCGLFIIDAVVQIGMQLTRFRPFPAWVSPAAIGLAACAAAGILAATWFASATHAGKRRVAAFATALAAVATLAGIESVARAQPDAYATSKAFTASVRPPRIVAYYPQNRSEATYFSGLGYHLLVDGDVLPSLAALSVHDEIAPALPPGNEGDLLVMHAVASAEPRFIRYKTLFEQRVAGTNWKSVYSDPVTTAYVWTRSPR